MPEPVPVTVVIATRNRRDDLARTLTELAGLPERPPVIVVDNGSADGTADLVRTEFPAVRLEPLPVNHGAAARNVGVRLASTPYVAFSDDDSWWEPGALAQATQSFQRWPRLALLVARIRVGPDGRSDHVSEKMAQVPLGQATDLPGPSVLGFPACAAVVRRVAFLDVGGFSDLLFFGGEESLLGLDLAGRGWGLAYDASVAARHCPPAGRTDQPDRWALQTRNDLLTGWMRLSYRHCVPRTGRLAVRALHDPAARSALGGLLVRLPAALRQRHRVAPEWEQRLRASNELQ
jgi:GT2 family glycosyltransferase